MEPTAYQREARIELVGAVVASGASVGAHWTVALAIASLLISALSLAWSAIVATRLDSARLKVDIEAQYVIVGASSRRVVAVTATNVGRRATRLNSLWLIFGRPQRWYHRVVPPVRRRTVGLLIPDLAWTSFNTTLPTLLDVGDQAVVFYSAEVVLARAQEHDERTAYGSANGSTARAHSRPISVKRIGAKEQ